ncbi:restriction endonuclease subunit S [Globicatella sulfidifaciens]|uniref:Type I restriction modification DNA specificity domain-containing protein n=1 Tax=Globicatella sulfidifaciens TaxID=136093 RepID=A0A7X8C5M8_9LACT|nr:restriction endonuclease subunit S [Globicatella sulfidifaciens]NLJ19445.1 hypothetical protein [Globicatella sulfidifaciens]
MVKTIRKNTFWETKIGIIPKDWRIVSLDETSTLHARIGWQGLTTDEYRTVGKFKLVSGTNFTNGKINWETCNYIDKYRFEQDKNIQLRNEDVLVTKDGSIGKIAYVEMDNEKATLNSGVFVVRPKRNTYYPKFMYYIFASDYFIEFLNKLTAGSTIVHLYQKDFINFKYPLPSMKEQQKIATALSDMDDLIESLEKIIEKKKKIKQGTMQQLLTGEKRLPGFVGEWTTKKIGDFCTTYSGGTPSTKNPKYYNGDIPWITSQELNRSRIYKVDYRISKKGLEESSARLIKEDTLLLAMYGATAGISSISKIKGAINQAILAILPEDASSVYLYYLLTYLKKDIVSKYTQGGQPNLSNNIIRLLELNLPNLREQQAIAEILSDMDAEIEALEEKLEKYKKLKEGMMQELLTGRIRLV